MYCLQEWAKDNDFELEGKTALVQGYGKVGAHAAMILSRLGVSIVGVGDYTGYRLNLEGFNAHRLADYVKKHGSIKDYDSGEPCTRADFFAAKADILIPAALHNQIGETEAKALNARVILEGANGPVMADGDAILRERGIDVVPDILANAGGVTVSYYEWVQNGRQESWDLEEVDERLERAMRRAYRRVVEFATRARLHDARSGVCAGVQPAGRRVQAALDLSVAAPAARPAQRPVALRRRAAHTTRERSPRRPGCNPRRPESRAGLGVARAV